MPRTQTNAEKLIFSMGWEFLADDAVLIAPFSMASRRRIPC